MANKVKGLPAPKQKGHLTAELLGQFVRAKRTQSKLRLEDAALLCNVAKDTLSKIETARGGVRFESVLQVCQMLGIELRVTPWEDEAENES
ncbi:MAG: transcriptional regulator [Bdellovibrionales bacterium GWA2_49_15]|nr:MAG: transcriptional regulator [Bdellovibrionales bacterium GWA2_49_15]HAZ11693.1 XRE family transcriptional regulator [Bdellovibrionales bacterium]